MVRCQAHNLETVIACVGSTPTSATNFNNMEKTMLSRIFATTRDLCDFVNKNNINREDIISIVVSRDGSYAIFYYK